MNGSKLAELLIPYPNQLTEQRRIVARIEELTCRAEEARETTTEREAELNILLQALYSRMVEGADWKPLKEVASLVGIEAKPGERRMP